MEIVVPPPLLVVPLLGIDELARIKRAGTVEPTTKMFRDGTGLDESLAKAADLDSAAEQLHVISAACSYGPEKDTVAALSYANFPNRQVTVTGIDRNERALHAGLWGGYLLEMALGSVRAEYENWNLDFNDEMAKHGIEIVPVPDVKYFDTAIMMDKLRKRYAMHSVQADLRLQRPDCEVAELVLGHNFIYHLDMLEADLVMNSLVKLVADGGYVSLGIIKPDTKMGQTSLKGKDNKPLFESWWERAVDNLSHAGMKPANTRCTNLRMLQKAA